MFEQLKSLFVGVMLAVLAFLKPIQGELSSLLLIFFINFMFGYLSGMIANHEDFDIKKAFRCLGEASIFFFLCCTIFAIGQQKGEPLGALQCVSFVTYVVVYFYALNVLKNLKKIFRQGSAPWMAVSFIYYVLRFKFVERIPFLSDYLNTKVNQQQ